MGRFVVKFRKIILALAILLLIPSIVGYFNTHVNYDMLTYLPDSMETVQGQKELLESFHKGGFSMLITEDLPESEQAKLEEKFKQIPHVDTVLGFGTLENANIPATILPDELYNKFQNGHESIIAVFFDTSTSADETIEAVTEIRKIADGHVYVSGMPAFATDLKNLSGSEEYFYVIIAVLLAIVTMLLLLDNWLAPVLFLVSIGIMIVINLGTNIFLGEISYITKSLSAVLQLAVTMDYSIFLWHSYREFLNQEKTKNHEFAMAKAIKATMSSVLGGSATTIAGFLALCFMTFGLGLDLGIVMAKGVVLGVIGSITVLPALILVFKDIITKLDHRPILPDFTKISRIIVRVFPALLIVFAAIIPPSIIGYTKTNDDVYYTISDSLPSDMEFAIANQKLSENFGMSNVHMALTSSNLDQVTVYNMSNELKNVSGIKSVLNLESLLGQEVPIEILPNSVIEIAKNDKWELTILLSEYHTATDEIASQIKDINQIIKKYDEKALLVSESSSTQDMINLTSVDFQVVNIISIVAIFIIIAIVTKSISLPFILIIVIETAIFINLGLCYYTGQQLSFITPICISTIQFGATIDYAILMTTRYKRERIDGQDKKSASIIALKASIPSIIISGAVLFSATIGVAIFSHADMISSMCMLMARGAIISIFTVPLFLTPMLIITDPLIIRTTLDMNQLRKENHK